MARDAEQLGYRALLLPDHQGSGGTIVGMAVAGDSTTTLRVGTLMLAIDFQHPVVLAQELATLDVMLGGRLEIGLGAGWMRRDYFRTGVAMDGAFARIERLREFVCVLRELWSGEPVHRDGPIYRFEGAVLTPRPGGGSSFALGGGGRRMLEVAAELADIVNVSATMSAGSKDAPLGRSASVEAFDQRRGWIDATCDRLGRRPVLQCLAYETHVTELARDDIERAVATSFGVPVEDVVGSPLALIGTVDELCDKLQRLRERLSITYWVVKSPAMYDFAPVVERLAGR